MNVAELIAILQTMPQDLPVEVNDNRGGEVYAVDSVDCFLWEDFESGSTDEPAVVIQVNC